MPEKPSFPFLSNAVGFLHSRKVIHQDLRGKNIYFVKKANVQTVKISDSNIQGLIPLIPNRYTVNYQYSNMEKKKSQIALKEGYIAFPYEPLFYWRGG